MIGKTGLADDVKRTSPDEREGLAALLDVVQVSEAEAERARRCELMMRQQLQSYGKKA